MSTDNSTSNDDVSEVVADYKYRLVVFVGKKKKKDIDIVPSSWIFYDEKTDTIKCKFMPPPYDVKRSDTLSKMVQNCEQPINDWPVYSVDIRGRARTFEEANELAIQLEYKPFAYSTQNEETAKVKAANDVHFFKNRKTFRDESLKMLNEINIDLGEKTRVNRAQPSSQKLPTEEDKQDRYYSSTDSDEEHCYDASRSKKKKTITITRNFGELLRYCISRDVGLMFAPVKTSKKKSHVFKDTCLFKVIKATLRKVFSKPGEDVPDQNILDAMASALHNCKDWDGGRTARSKKPAEANSEIDNEHLD
ncbi:uncharacterized protein LOC130898266 [Diorhabda carinulata]|uniref:uncharacterized protein LOC130898266 n=1 Tax=Diorhabda carinulata TaxID=1163345 RepID=UPI0025A2942D|nr:uncharacterized protein LOC130898266 [Diorhabda carinulata]